MGRSNPARYVPNPASKTIEWSSKHKCFRMYDKELKESVSLDMPFRFAVAEELSTVTGFNKKYGASIYANEVKHLKDQVLEPFMRVRVGQEYEKRELDAGLWSEIKDSVTSKSIGGKFCKSIYAVADGANGPLGDGETFRLILSGGGFGAWVDKGFESTSEGIACYECAQRENGDTTYFVPVFKSEAISNELDAKAIQADKAVQAWIDQVPEGAPPVAEPVSKEQDDMDEPPF